MPRLTPRKTPQQGRSRALVDAILEASRRLLVDVGFEQTTIAEIGRVAGVSPGSLYQYFPSKESVLTALHISVLEERVEYLAENLLEVRESPLEAVVELIAGVWMRLERDEGALLQTLEQISPVVGAEPKIEPAREKRRRLLESFLVTRTELDPEGASRRSLLTCATLDAAVKSLRLADPATLDDPAELARLAAVAMALIR